MGKSAQDIYATALTILQVGQPTIWLPPNPDFNSLSPEEKDWVYQDLHNQIDSLIYGGYSLLTGHYRLETLDQLWNEVSPTRSL
jgi:hypothetical protein